MNVKKKSLGEVFSESTLMPVSLVLTVGGIVFWASSIAAHTESNAARIVRLEQKQETVVQMREDISAISAKVDMIYDRIRAHEDAGMIIPPTKKLRR